MILELLSTLFLGYRGRVKAHTHTATFAATELESALKSVDSSSESADSNTDAPAGM